MKDYSKWIEAAKQLVENQYAQVLCPDCGLGFLVVDDNRVDESHFERHLKCSNCGAHETVFKRQSAEGGARGEETP
jgi:ribosomal protein S27E